MLKNSSDDGMDRVLESERARLVSFAAISVVMALKISLSGNTEIKTPQSLQGLIDRRVSDLSDTGFVSRLSLATNYSIFYPYASLDLINNKLKSGVFDISIEQLNSELMKIACTNAVLYLQSIANANPQNLKNVQEVIAKIEGLETEINIALAHFTDSQLCTPPNPIDQNYFEFKAEEKYYLNETLKEVLIKLVQQRAEIASHAGFVHVRSIMDAELSLQEFLNQVASNPVTSKFIITQTEVKKLLTEPGYSKQLISEFANLPEAILLINEANLKLVKSSLTGASEYLKGIGAIPVKTLKTIQRFNYQLVSPNSRRGEFSISVTEPIVEQTGIAAIRQRVTQSLLQ